MPPLRYEDVYRLKQDFPHLWIDINGGVKTLKQTQAHLQYVDAVMIGRAAYDTPYIFAESDRRLFGDDREPKTRAEVVYAMLPYIDHWTSQGLKLNSITRHMLMLFHGQPGSRTWRRVITENACLPGAGSEVLKDALTEVEQVRINARQFVESHSA